MSWPTGGKHVCPHLGEAGRACLFVCLLEVQLEQLTQILLLKLGSKLSKLFLVCSVLFV